MANKTNVDDAELKRFEALSNHWWDLEGPLKTLHDINPLRLNYIQRFLKTKQEKILDIGCGGGLLTEGLYVFSPNITGIDLAKASINVAIEHAESRQLKIDYLLESAEAHAETNPGTYDLITCLECLEHVPDVQSILNACYQMLKPGGILIVSTINRSLRAFALAIVGAEHILKIVPKHTHEYKKFIKPHELDEWLSTAQLKLLESQGYSYNPLNRQAKLSSSLAVNYFLVASKPC